MALKIDLQIASTDADIPALKKFKLWAKKTLPLDKQNSEITIRVVDIAEITDLNKTYRNKNQPTNILSFPADIPPEVKTSFLGDIIICATIVKQEAKEQNKSTEEHWAHMTIHGCLHLLGYDHTTNAQAEIMEQNEIRILTELGYKNPYMI